MSRLPKLMNVVSCARELGMTVVERDGREMLRVSDPGTFDKRLIALQRSLEALGDDALTADVGEAQKDFVTEQYRIAVSSLVEMIKSVAQDRRPAHEIVEDAIRNHSTIARTKKAEKKFTLKPAPPAPKPPSVSPVGEVLSPITRTSATTMEEVQQEAFQRVMRFQSLGHALEDAEAYKRRARERAKADIERRRQQEAEPPPDSPDAPKA